MSIPAMSLVIKVAVRRQGCLIVVLMDPPMWMKWRWFIRLAYDYWTPLSLRGTSEEGEGPGVRAFGLAFLIVGWASRPSSDLFANVSGWSRIYRVNPVNPAILSKSSDCRNLVGHCRNDGCTSQKARRCR